MLRTKSKTLSATHKAVPSLELLETDFDDTGVFVVPHYAGASGWQPEGSAEGQRGPEVSQPVSAISSPPLMPNQVTSVSIGGLPVTNGSPSALPSDALPPPAVDVQLHFTEGLDELVGGIGNTEFIGDFSTVQSDDRIVGGGGYDTASLALEGTNQPLELHATNIDRISVAVGGATGLVMSAQWWTNVGEFWLSSADVTDQFVSVQHISQNMILGLSDYHGQAYFEFAGSNGSVTYPSLGIALEGGSSAELNLTGSASFEQLEINSSGPLTNSLVFNSSARGLHSIFILGDAHLVLSSADSTFQSVSLVDARNESGGLDFTIAGSQPLEFLGGLGNDTLHVTAKSAHFAALDGGGGYDTLDIDVQSLAALAAPISGFEALMLRGTLSSSAVLHALGDFQAVELVGRTTESGRDLQIKGFEKLTIDGDQYGTLFVSGDTARPVTEATIVLSEGADIFGTLNVSGLAHVMFQTNDPGQVAINGLVLSPYLSIERHTVSFSGAGNFKIGSVSGAVSEIDLSDMHGSWNGGASFGVGTDYAIGDLTGTSVIWLDQSPIANRASSELLFGAAKTGLDGLVQIHNFDLVESSRPTIHDVLDLGRLGVKSLAELAISVDHGDTFISSQAHQFNGEIQLIGVDLLSAPGGAAAYIEFNGAFG